MKNITNTLLLLFFVKLLSAQVPPIVYVSGNGTGDYNCDGSKDQIEINQALDFVAANADYTTVFLKGPYTYWIDNTVFISSNTILEGDETAIIKLIDNANWDTKYKPLIGQKGHALSLSLEDSTIRTNNITIRGFELDGNREKQTEPSGHSFYNGISLQNCTNITINNMYLHSNLSDLVQITQDLYGTDVNLQFFNNRVHGSGHDGIYVSQCINFEIYDNIFTNNRTDAHTRAQGCNEFKIHDNIMGNDPDRRNSGGIGVDIQSSYNKPLNDAEIYGNYIYGKGAFPGIWLWQTSAGGYLESHRDVHLHNNIISNCQGAGIAIYGFTNTLIENNVIDNNGIGSSRSYTDNVLIGKQGGIVFYEGAHKNKIKGFKTIVRNNIIVNNGSYGIVNKKPKIHSFVSEYNCIYNNNKGNYDNASSFTDIYVDPDFAAFETEVSEERTYYTYTILHNAWIDAQNNENWTGDLGAIAAKNVYHLKSELGRWNGNEWVSDDTTSFCINQGMPSSSYSSEPFPNGDRVNMGAFGNTNQASKSNHIASVNHFSVFPNPTTGILNVSVEFNSNYFEVFALSGEIVLKGYVIENEIDISDLNAGIYFVRLNEYRSNNTRVIKVVKI